MTCISDARSTALTSLCCLVSIHLLPHNVTALSSSTMKPPVLVVGAGPVGLTAANSLARFGIPVRIIDSNACPSKLSKALVMWRRSLHTLDGLIPYEQWLQHGRHVGGLDLADAGAIFAALDLQQPPSATAAPAPCQHMLPAGVLHTQSQIEAELEQHLQDSYGITVERSTKLESFTVDEVSGQIHCVLASTSQPDPAGSSTVDSSSTAEAQREMVASYLIGCDGARSAVRKGLGVPFPGFSDPDNRFLMMDCTYEHEPGINSNMPRVEAEGLPAPDRPMASTTAIGLVLVISLVDVPNAVRLVWNAGRLGTATQGGAHLACCSACTQTRQAAAACMQDPPGPAQSGVQAGCTWSWQLVGPMRVCGRRQVLVCAELSPSLFCCLSGCLSCCRPRWASTANPS